MELLNVILTTGTIQTLFSGEEKDEIINACRDKAQKSAFPSTK